MPAARRRVSSDSDFDEGQSLTTTQPRPAGPSARAKGKRRAVESESSDDDAEAPVAPKPSTGTDKRRLSRAPLADSSSSTDLGPRQSLGHGLPSALHGGALVQPGKMAALAAQAQRNASGGRTSSGLINPSGVHNGPLAPPAAPINTEQYEEWMKLATDGKINASNTWNFQLIDYFHDMSLLRNSDANSSLNFQKASCTLDGCVKVWTSRVDSVATETTKLLNGLAHGSAIADADDDDEDGDGEGDAENEDGGPKSKKRKRNARSIKTLVDDITKIQHKGLELEFSVDPLFKKTSADFDEGGASGILMNTLGVDTSLRIVFDALETLAMPEDDTPAAVDEDLDATVNVAALVAKHQDKLDDLDSLHICPTLTSFKFSLDASAMDLGLADVNPDAPAIAATGDFNHDDQHFFDDGGAGGDDMDDGGGADFFAPEGNALGDATALEARDPQLGVFARARAAKSSGDGGREGEYTTSVDDGVFDLFDSAFASKNWAGPSHWKMRRVASRVPAAKDESAAKTPARERKEKVVLQADFRAPPPSTKDLFAYSNASTRLAASARTDSHVLPDDLHFDSKQLLSFFLKPKSRVHIRQRGRVASPVGGLGDDQPLDENYWAQRAEERMNTDEPDESGAPPPFATQFFNDDGPDYDDDMAMGDDVGDIMGTQMPVNEEDDDVDLLATTSGKLKRVRPQFISYAKKAKRVDVRKLKESIWKEIEPEVAGEDLQTKPDFNNVIRGLRRAYPKDKMAELSTSWLFICVLHLGNEHGLRFQLDRDEATANILDNDAASTSVGRLTSLRITRES